MKIEKRWWGECNGYGIWLYTITNGRITFSITNYGCTFLSIFIDGRNVIVGYKELDDLLADKWYMNGLVGRFAGRIAGALFTIEGQDHRLSANDGNSGNHLHGGEKGFNTICFREKSQSCDSKLALISFYAVSPDLDQGYPGSLYTGCDISLSDHDEIRIVYYANTGKATHINLTHHFYYNLNGIENKTLPGTAQQLAINANSVLEADHQFIPTGRILPLAGDMNFTKPTPIPASRAFNDCYLLEKAGPGNPAAELWDSDHKLCMQLFTSCPGLIFYTGDYLSEPFYPKQGICLEAQYFPDTPNHPGFPSTLYSPSKQYREETLLRFKYTN
ncbi:MAG: galactose mutarotase [Chitinophagaceae bacterium]|nr:MAG: galactose mutarotase [Chitinophagaceae bacterium]